MSLIQELAQGQGPSPAPGDTVLIDYVLRRVTPAGGPAVEAPSLNAAYVALAALQQQQSSLPKPQLRLGAEMFG
ncbi:hypothetical protein HaLaN_20808 [Haematococcus lacustris]|uniref:Uncharacterized protein n=1 Tax=Haematococcus lacustris TaxID=44745 RepID=A0A699ZKN9_HAELA|nr:hypothetical protein HaLaN_20808 [Haematococcus lacustris]